MPQIVIEGTTRTNQALLDHGITDLVVHHTPAGAVLYASSGQNGGLTSYAIGPNGALSLLDYAHFHHSYSLGVMDRVAIIATANGAQMVVAQTLTGQLVTFRLAADGQILGTTTISGIARLGAGPQDLGQWNGDTLFVANGGTGPIEGYAFSGPARLDRAFAVTGAPASYSTSVFRLETLSQGGSDYLLGASRADRGVVAYRIQPGGLVATGHLGVEEGLGIMAPTAMATVQMGARHFILLASVPDDGVGHSGAISVMELRLDGSLWPTDHVTDTLHTRFGGVQGLEVITANGMTYVIAAGGDDGVSVFVLLPNGRLQILDTITDQFDIGLENVTAIAATHGTGKLHLFVASQASAGVTELSLDTAGNGAVLMAPNTPANITGTALNDILIGGLGDDRLAGGAGDDILEDGAGRDIFVLRSDGAPDRITDFEPGRDRLDLSDWPFLYDPSALSILPTATGATVTWRGETLAIDTADGTPLSAPALLGAILVTPHRTPFFSEIWAPPDRFLMGTSNPDSISGGSGDDTLDGQDGNDTLQGNSGNDTLFGSNGFDLLTGGDGNDLLDGGEQADNLYGGDGADTLSGGLGRDRLFGGTGDDSLAGGEGDDVLWGEDGNDVLSGADGQDRLFGGSGQDDLDGGDGNDSLWGDAGFDRLYGGQGDDSLDGGPQADQLYGGDGNDVLRGSTGLDHLFGGFGDDVLDGGSDNDLLVGGDGQDELNGAAHNDRLLGEAGNDRLFGGAGFDMLYGGDGDDHLDGGEQADNLFGGAGGDTLLGGSGFDRLFGDRGNDSLAAGMADDALFGGSENDTLDGDTGHDRLYGGSGNDLCLGGDGNDLINGGSGFDRLDGGAGNDALWGAFNADTFIFADGHGIDTIHDFNARNSLEKIDLSSLSSLGSLAAVLGPGGAASQVGGDVLIDTGGGNLIWVLNTELGDLDASNFVF